MIERLRRMFLRRSDEVDDELERELAAARSEHRAALAAGERSRRHVERALVERERLNDAMRAADVAMFGERMEQR